MLGKEALIEKRVSITFLVHVARGNVVVVSREV
jgi:hypothetical protein